MRGLQNNMASSKAFEIVSEDSIRAMIIPVRGQQVMLDRDLAILYGVEVKYLNRQVKRNIEPKSLLIKFIRRAKKELIVIDACPGVATLDMLAKRGRGVKIALADWRSQNVTAKTDVKEAA